MLDSTHWLARVYSTLPSINVSWGSRRRAIRRSNCNGRTIATCELSLKSIRSVIVSLSTGFVSEYW